MKISINLILLLASFLLTHVSAEPTEPSDARQESVVSDPLSWATGVEKAPLSFIEIAPSYFIKIKSIESISYSDDTITIVLDSQRTLRITSNNKFYKTSSVFFHFTELLNQGYREVTQPSKEQRDALVAELEAECNRPEFDQNSVDFIIQSAHYLGSLSWKVIASYCRLQVEEK